jgi:hypothetical protein
MSSVSCLTNGPHFNKRTRQMPFSGFGPRLSLSLRSRGAPLAGVSNASDPVVMGYRSEGHCSGCLVPMQGLISSHIAQALH